MEKVKMDHVLCSRNGSFPNNDQLELCVFKKVFQGSGTRLAKQIEVTFTTNGWPAAWRNGLFAFHHFHSTAHEALGIYSGWVKACFGGPGGKVLKAETGDVIIIPAGVSHQNLNQADDFSVVGAYPVGQRYNMKYGGPEELSRVTEEISRVPLPEADPVFGSDGPLMQLWGK